MTFQTDGECYNNLNRHGCITTFHVADIYTALCFHVIDAILFGAFCYKWRKMAQIFKMSESDHKIPIKVLQSFMIQFMLTVIAMSSSFMDGLLHLILHDHGKNYHIMNIYLFDCTVIATCNFCMISESQAIIMKFICFCCPQRQKKEIHPITNRRSMAEVSMAYLAKGSNRPSTNQHLPPIPPEIVMGATTSSFESAVDNKDEIEVDVRTDLDEDDMKKSEK